MHLAINLVYFLSIEDVIEHYKSPLNLLDSHCQIKKKITIIISGKQHGNKINLLNMYVGVH